jgi:hypothetical protein
LKRYIIERDIPGLGAMTNAEYCDMSRASNKVLADLAPKVQWDHSYVTKDKLFCVYLADSEAAVLEHAKRGGFPANKVTQVSRIIDPVTGA